MELGLQLQPLRPNKSTYCSPFFGAASCFSAQGPADSKCFFVNYVDASKCPLIIHKYAYYEFVILELHMRVERQKGDRTVRTGGADGPHARRAN
jgi:hypothetical protein